MRLTTRPELKYRSAALYPGRGGASRRRAAGLLAALMAALMAPAGFAQPFRDAFQSVTDVNFDDGGSPSRQFHLNAASYHPQATIYRTTPPRALRRREASPVAAIRVRHDDTESRFADYVATDPLLDAVLVLHEGEVAFEAYPNMQPWQRHFAWSVTKVLTSTTLATLVADGRVAMHEPVARYVPELADSAWGTIPLQNLADMASGIDCLDSDGYQDQETCVYRLEESLGLTASTGRELDFVDTLKSMQRRGKPGEINEYVSANTNVLALVIENVLQLDFAAAVRERVWSRIGAEADAFITVNDKGYAYASGGLSARLRDLGRFGEVFMPYDESGVLSEELRAAMANGGVPLDDPDGLKSRFGSDVPVRASWQWDLVWEDGAMFKGGYSGQGLYVDPKRELVVAWFGTGLDYSARVNAMLPMARQLSQGLDSPEP